MIVAGALALAGLVFNVLWGQELLPYLSRITLGPSCFGVMALSIWAA